MATETGPVYQRVLLKLSGEAFAHQGGFGIDSEELQQAADEIKRATEVGTQLAVVVGGGNIIRGATLAKEGVINQSTADYMGMLGTVMNAVALKEALEGIGQPARVLSAIDIPMMAERFVRAKAIHYLQKGDVVIFAAGTGNPFFTTDTAAALRATEIEATALLKATKVDGIYDKDPMKFDDAKRYEQLSYDEAIEKKLGVMDMTALCMCMEHKIPILVFDMKQQGHITRAVSGETLGTKVSAEATVQAD